MLRIFASMLPRLSPGDQQAAVTDIARVLSTVTGHVLTEAAARLRRSLHESGFADTAARFNEVVTETASQTHEPAPTDNDGSDRPDILE